MFAINMRKVALDLMTEFGNACVLSKITPGVYNPATGKTDEVRVDIPTYSAQESKMNVMFAQMGQNTNLTAFDSESLIVPWVGEEIDPTWLYNGHNILSVSPITSQDKIVVYNIRVGEKK